MYKKKKKKNKIENAFKSHKIIDILCGFKKLNYNYRLKTFPICSNYIDLFINLFNIMQSR